MSPATGRILTQIQRALTAPEPLDALHALTALRAELDAYERAQVRRALEHGDSFAAIARELGISRQAAHRRYRGLAPHAPAFTPRALRLLQLARQEAARDGADCVELEHVERVRSGRGRPATSRPGPTRIGPRLRAALARADMPIDLEDLEERVPQRFGMIRGLPRPPTPPSRTRCARSGKPLVGLDALGRGARAVRAREQRRGDHLTLGEWPARLGGGLGGRSDLPHLREDELMRRGDQPGIHVGPNVFRSLVGVKRKWSQFLYDNRPKGVNSYAC